MKHSTNGIEINYVIEGEGPVVTMSHALGTNLSLWDEQAGALRGRYRVLRFDTRGHGQTSAPPGPYSLEQLADDAAALHPAAAAPIWQERIRTVEAKGMEALVAPTLERWFTAPFRARRKDLLERVGEMIRRTSPQGYIGCCHALPKINVTDRLKELQCPALVIVGEEDPGTPVEMAREIHAALPGAELAILRSASHLSNLEQPYEFNRALVRFLDKATGRSTL